MTYKDGRIEELKKLVVKRENLLKTANGMDTPEITRIKKEIEEIRSEISQINEKEQEIKRRESSKRIKKSA